MEVQSVCRGLYAPKSNSFTSSTSLKDRMVLRNRSTLNACSRLGWKQMIEESVFYSLKRRGRIAMCASSSDSAKSSGVPIVRSSGVEPFRGKSGSVSFHGLTHQLVEEGKLESAPFVEGKGSFLWVLAPISLISSLILPQFILGNAIEVFVKNETLVEIVTTFFSEAMFYAGLAAFLLITDRIQRPFLHFSPKRWSLITGLRGYLNSVFLTMGFKVVIPLFMVYITWPVVGVPGLVAVAPFLIGCLAQLIFEKILDKNGSSCWPVVPIIFEVYRLYQLTKAAHYIELLMFAMKDLSRTPEMLDRSGALVAIIVSFQVLGLLCLWSLTTFLLRLFPSRPVSENY